MKKFSRFLFAFLFSLIVAFVSFPFPDIKAAPSWDNIIYSIKANLGMVSVANGSLSALDNTDFYLSLYETPLVQNGVTFVPAQTFSSKGEWVDTCQNRGNPGVVGFTDFDIVQSLQDSGYIQKSSSGYDFSNLPQLGEGFLNSQNPIDGVKVITNFAPYSINFNYTYRPSYNETVFNSLKNSYISNFGNVTIICGYNTSLRGQVAYFSSFDNSIDYYYFLLTNNGNMIQTVPYVHSNTWISVYNSSYYKMNNLNNSNVNSYYYLSNPQSFQNVLSNDISFDSSNTSVNSTSAIAMSLNTKDTTYPLYFYSTIPVVLASSSRAGENYYYWLKGSPSGSIYTTANSGNVYTTEYIENNDWSQIYNNYITDVSNYYSTTENITNEQLSQYIDNSTTITNITNNYITNNGGSGEDDIITNSWLERIYNKLVEIKSILLGRGDPDDNSDYITENGIKNDILHAPASDLFPDVPVEDFITDSEDFTVDLFATKLSTVLTEAIPFCYIYILGEAADSLKASPSPPYWEIPFTIERLNIDENLTLDMTSSDWDSVHNVWIALFMIIFVSYLFYLSYRVIMLVSNLFA